MYIFISDIEFIEKKCQMYIFFSFTEPIFAIIEKTVLSAINEQWLA